MRVKLFVFFCLVSWACEASAVQKKTCDVIKPGVLECDGITFVAEEKAEPGSPTFYHDIIISICLILGAALAAGLTMGLMSLDRMNLEILERSGTETQKAQAARILPLVKQHHLLLVTLLLMNAACNEALPLFLDNLMDPATTVIVSVTAVLLFGEIIPQALCQAHALAIGAYCAPLVWLLIGVSFIISYPIAKILDCCLGHQAYNFYSRFQLKELVDMHHISVGNNDEVSAQSPGEPLTQDECMIIQGALDLRNKCASECMTSIEDAFMLDYNDVLDEHTMSSIASAGHSRIPVYMGDRHKDPQVVGMILVKNLIMVSPADKTPIREITLRRMPTVPTNEGLYDLLNLFQEGRRHMAMVVDPRDHMTYKGVVTLEDVIEQLIQEPIEDECDHDHPLMGASVRSNNKGSVPSSRYGSIALFQKSGPRYRRQHSSKGAEDDAPSSPPSTERTPLLSDQGMSSTPKK
jgi:ankyrin repeat/SOCS box protein 13/metal transporter CNNM